MHTHATSAFLGVEAMVDEVEIPSKLHSYCAAYYSSHEEHRIMLSMPNKRKLTYANYL